MICPFYGVSLTSFGQLVRFVGSPNNRCALVTSAHSPCWMEVAEHGPPNWAQCPRNPEFQALALGHDADGRINECSLHLQRLMRMRVAGDPL